MHVDTLMSAVSKTQTKKKHCKEEKSIRKTERDGSVHNKNRKRYINK